jgi:hypothetical protein
LVLVFTKCKHFSPLIAAVQNPSACCKITSLADAVETVDLLLEAGALVGPKELLAGAELVATCQQQQQQQQQCHRQQGQQQQQQPDARVALSSRLLQKLVTAAGSVVRDSEGRTALLLLAAYLVQGKILGALCVLLAHGAAPMPQHKTA